jgi:cardiolipin synthase
MAEMNAESGIVEAPRPRTRRSEILLLPNLLSLTRILLTPVFVLMMIQGKSEQAFIVFLAAGATDALDGFTARLLHLKSTLGLWLDPIGDKLLLTTAFIVLTVPAVAGLNVLPVWLTALCIGRDVAIALGALIIVALRGRRTFPPTLAGKASTICQVFLMYFMLYLNAAGKTPESLGWLYLLTGLLTAVSWVQYGFIGVGMLRAPRVPPAA